MPDRQKVSDFRRKGSWAPESRSVDELGQMQRGRGWGPGGRGSSFSNSIRRQAGGATSFGDRLIWLPFVIFNDVAASGTAWRHGGTGTTTTTTTTE